MYHDPSKGFVGNPCALTLRQKLTATHIPELATCDLRSVEPVQLRTDIWVAVKELELRYRAPETVLFAIDPYFGNLNRVP